ncbi:unnamed protein product [Rhizoctonia solani]|uniref:DUF6535 domain-containing protein n=1 Tax=Rhizoctonia solani TaxID=456999 RepID=A0A8H3GFI4_9AGAM|nr:unnamed protein product [Rhizoctonia solani]
MSPLIPTNLSNGAKERRKQARPNTWSPLDYPEFVWEGMPHNAPATDERLQPKPDQKTNDEAHKKTSAVPVVMVNPDPLQMMEPDEYGAELGKEARVWKVYVKETDRWDAELVGGWNKSLDVILVFAALFSAVSTAFLIESSRKLQQDPSDVSAAALLRISQTLVAMTTNSSVELPPISPKSQLEPGFVPSRNAIVVNTLWYLSLSLSIATSLLAMLAKDWCHSFAANRTGHPWDQALRRQRKWVMIERWGVRELFIAVLPFLIHLSLLVFAVGLCIYVWDMNSTVAIPLICVCGLALGFYLWSSVMASFVKLFPYTTIISRALRSDGVRLRYNSMKKRGKTLISQVTPWLFLGLKYISVALYLIPTLIVAIACFPLLVLDFIRSLISRSSDGYISIDDGYFSESLGTADKFVHDMGDYIYRWFFYILVGVSMYVETLRSHQPHESDSDQDQMTSLAVKWLIQTCNTPGSVAIALQAIAGASPRIPKEPLEACQATLHILRRLVSSNPDDRTESENLLYSRALTVLGSHDTSSQSTPEGSTIGDIEVAIWDLKSEVERQVVELINNTDFSPTEDNLGALKIGNTATSLSLRLLKGADQTASETFHSVISLLSDHIESENTKFYQATLLSLSNAAILLTSCSTTSLLCPTILHQFKSNA